MKLRKDEGTVIFGVLAPGTVWPRSTFASLEKCPLCGRSRHKGPRWCAHGIPGRGQGFPLWTLSGLSMTLWLWIKMIEFLWNLNPGKTKVEICCRIGSSKTCLLPPSYRNRRSHGLSGFHSIPWLSNENPMRIVWEFMRIPGFVFPRLGQLSLLGEKEPQSRLLQATFVQFCVTSAVTSETYTLDFDHVDRCTTSWALCIASTWSRFTSPFVARLHVPGASASKMWLHTSRSTQKKCWGKREPYSLAAFARSLVDGFSRSSSFYRISWPAAWFKHFVAFHKTKSVLAGSGFHSVCWIFVGP